MVAMVKDLILSDLRRIFEISGDVYDEDEFSRGNAREKQLLYILRLGSDYSGTSIDFDASSLP
jgi:hypothetical protein